MPDTPADSPDAAQPRGADLARQALESARRVNAARRAANPERSQPPGAVRSGSAGRLTRRRWSGAGPDARDPQPFGEVLRKVVRQTGSADDLRKATVMAQWAAIVGERIAEHCAPANLVDGELLLQCSSTAWASQLRLMAPQLVRKINEAVGHGSVARIRAVGPAAPSWRFGPRHVAGRGPRDTYG